MLVEGTKVAFGGLVGFLVLFVIMVRRARAGKFWGIRRLPALDALPEAVGRAAETNSHVVFSAGGGRLYRGDDAPQMVAGMGVLGYLCRLAGELRVKVLTTARYAETLSMLDATMKRGYLEGGNPDLFNAETDVSYLGSEGNSWHLGTMGLIARTRPAATVLVGAFYMEAVMLAEAGAAVGALQIGGTAKLNQLPFLVAACDYSLIGEEVYAAGAYLSRDPVQVATLSVADIVKFVVVALVVIGSIMCTTGSKALIRILSQ